MVTASPPVSPRVVAAPLMIQKINVTSGTLLGARSIGGVMLSSPGSGSPHPAQDGGRPGQSYGRVRNTWPADLLQVLRETSMVRCPANTHMRSSWPVPRLSHALLTLALPAAL